MMNDAIVVRLNGEECRCPAGLSLEALLEQRGYRPRLVVVEYNGALLPRRQWPTQPVVESDVIEVVTIVGGGS